MIQWDYKKDTRISNTAIDKLDFKCDCISGSFANGINEPILFSFALDKPPRQKIFKEPKIRLFE